MNTIANYFQNFISNTFCPVNQELENDKDFLNFLQVYFVLTVGMMSINVANNSLNYFLNLHSFKSLLFKPKVTVEDIPSLDSESEEDSSDEDEELVTTKDVNAYGMLLNKIAM